MKQILLSWLLFVVLLCDAQVLTIRDNINRQPLEMVTIISKEPLASAVTDINGQAHITQFKGSILINIKSVGYEEMNISFADLESVQFKLFLKQSNMTLDEVVISATKWGQSRTNVPTKITTITPFEIAFQNPRTSADMLGNIGFVFIQQSQLGGGSPMIRGFATNRILINVDGTRFNNAIFRGGNVQNVISIDPFTIEKTEIIYGPGSVIYGSDAIGGVMSFYTITPKFSTTDKPMIQGSAEMRYSSAVFEKTGHVDLNIGLKKWAFVTSATFSDFDDLRMGKNGPEEYLRNHYVETINGADSMLVNPDPLVQVPTGYSQINLLQKIRYTPNKNWDLSYIFQYSSTTDIPRYDRLIMYKNDKLKAAEWYYGPQNWMTNSLTITQFGGLKIYDVSKLSIAFQIFEESRHNRDFGKTIMYNRFEKVNAWSVNLDFEKKLNEMNHFYYGIDVILNTVFSTGNDENVKTGEVVPGPSRYPDGSTWNSYAAYINYQLKINEQLKLQSGLRYSLVFIDAEFDTTFYPFPFTDLSSKNKALNGSIGLIYTPTTKWLFSMGMTTGFRAPNIDDVGKVFESEPGSVVVPNPELEPEYAWNFEAGVGKIFGESVKLDIYAYYTWLDNAMVRRDFFLDGMDSIYFDGEWSNIQAIQNSANAYIYGIQASIDIKFLESIQFSSRFNFQKGEEELDDGSTAPLRHAAPWFGLTRLTWNWNRIKAEINSQYSGEVTYANLPPSEREKPYIYATDADGNPYSPAWYTVNFKIMYQFTDYLMANFGVENITNQRYRPYSSGIVSPGLNFIASLKLNF